MNSIAAAPIHHVRSMDTNIVLAIFLPRSQSDDWRHAMNFLRPYSAQLLSLLRIMSGLLLLQHGTTKYLNFPVGPMNNATPMTMSGAAGLIELIGGVLIVIGLFTRPVAFIISGMTAVAYFYAHAHQGFFPILNRGELAALYCFVFLYLAAAGGGAFSLDRLWHGNND
jgi:putative oxidoreductase